MTAAKKIRPADVIVGDTLITPHGDRWPVVGATVETIQVRDDSIDRSAAWSRYAPSTKWYTRRSKIIASWTVDRS
jgi:hypothetical protein